MIKILKKIMQFFAEKRKENYGFVMLFAVIISSIILAIALGVANIALKELNFDTSAKSTNDAFFAADTATECALYYDLAASDTSSFGVPSLDTIVECAGTDLDLNNGSSVPSTGPWQFVLYPLGSSGNACAVVDVEKTYAPDPESTSIVARGYNIGGNTVDCTSTNKNRVERELYVTIGEPPTPPNYYDLNVTVSGGGNVLSDVGSINCPDVSCVSTYQENVVVNLSASAEIGYIFNGWSDPSCTGTVCTVTMDSAKNITANFAGANYTLTLIKGGTGDGTVSSNPSGISCGTGCPSQSFQFPAGQAVSLSQSADAGSVFVNWAGACTGSGSCGFNMDSNKFVTANFNTVSSYPIIESSIASSVNSDSWSHTVSLSSGIQPNDLLLVFFSIDGIPDLSAWPSGWTQLMEDTTQSPFETFAVYYKIADGTEGSSLTFSIGGANPERSAHQAFRISGYGSVPQLAYTISAGSTNNPDSPNLNLSGLVKPTLWFSGVGRENGTTTTTTYPSGYNSGTTKQTLGGNFGSSQSVAYKELTSNSDDPGAHLLSASDLWIAATVAIKGQ